MRTVALLGLALFGLSSSLNGAAAQGVLLPEDGPFGQPPVAEEPADVPEPMEPVETELTRSEMLDQLFATLSTTDDSTVAHRTENRINAIWMDSGSDTIDLLMQWTQQAIEEEDLPLALDYLDRVVSLDPTFVEGWNKRATVLFMTDEYGKSIGDLEQVLAIEPRHFGALSGLGTIMRSVGDKDRAIDAYKRALELDPYLESVRDALLEVEAEVKGSEA